MFSKSSNSQNSATSAATGARHTPFSIIGGDVVVRGDIEARVDLHIDGQVEGDIAFVDLQVLHRFRTDEILAGIGIEDHREGVQESRLRD